MATEPNFSPEQSSPELNLNTFILFWKKMRGRRARRFRAWFLLILITLGSLLVGNTRNLAQPSQAEYQFMKLQAESIRLEREREELGKRQEVESLRVASYNDELAKVCSEFQSHIADQHQRVVSCKKCRYLSKKMMDLSRKIERGLH